jgi:syntaxin 16
MSRLTKRESQASHWERETRAILQSVQELNSIMKDISVLVIEQGTVVDRIDYNLDQAEVALDSSIENIQAVCLSLSLSPSSPSRSL